MWGGIFSLTDCGLIHFRQKEDYINPIVAGFFTGGVLAFRGIKKLKFYKRKTFYREKENKRFYKQNKKCSL